MAIFPQIALGSRTQQLGRYLKAEAIKLWLSKTCLLCTASVINKHSICDACKLDLPWLMHGCRYCALAIPAGDSSCRKCQQQLQPFSLVVAPWTYNFPINVLIARFKYRSQWAYGKLLSQVLAEYLQFQLHELNIPRPDCLLAVPLAAKRQRQRGYNQAQMIAQWVGHELDVPVLQHAVKRVRYTDIQQGLSAQQRQHNVRNAFVVGLPEQVQGRHVVVVDDVLTTGATCAALARSLLAAGARRVDVYCLARTSFAVPVV